MIYPRCSRPTGQPSTQPSSIPSLVTTKTTPTKIPTAVPTVVIPSYSPTVVPSRPSGQPSGKEFFLDNHTPLIPLTFHSLIHHLSDTPLINNNTPGQPTSQPSHRPSIMPTQQPTSEPTNQPTCQPSDQPSKQPTSQPTRQVRVIDSDIQLSSYRLMCSLCNILFFFKYYYSSAVANSTTNHAAERTAYNATIHATQQVHDLPLFYLSFQFFFFDDLFLFFRSSLGSLSFILLHSLVNRLANLHSNLLVSLHDNLRRNLARIQLNNPHDRFTQI